jgi:hypothetical protein
MEPCIDEPKTLIEKQPLENAPPLDPTVQTSPQQESRAQSSSIPSLSDNGKDPEKLLPKTTIENKDPDKNGSSNEAGVDSDLVGEGLSNFTSCKC